MAKQGWLFTKHPIVVDPDVAMAIGSVDKAIVLQQINYWLHSKSAKKINNKLWIYNTYDNWKKDNFPFWSIAKIKRIFASLEDDGLVIAANYNSKGFDKTKWYSIDENRLNQVMNSYYEKLENDGQTDNHTSSKNERPSYQNDTTVVSKCDDGSYQNDTLDRIKMNQPIPETTRDYTETTTDINRSSEDDHKHQCSKSNSNNSSSLKESDYKKEFEELWAKYPRKEGKQKAFTHYKHWRKKSKKYTKEYISQRLDAYINSIQKNHTERRYIKQGGTWFNGAFDDVLDVDESKSNDGGFGQDMMARMPDDDDLRDVPF